MMKRFTAKQRADIYLGLAKRFASRRVYPSGICDHLKHLVDRDFYESLFDIFNEFSLFKPKRNEDKSWWWARTDTDSRIIALLFAHQMALNP